MCGQGRGSGGPFLQIFISPYNGSQKRNREMKLTNGKKHKYDSMHDTFIEYKLTLYFVHEFFFVLCCRNTLGR